VNLGRDHGAGVEIDGVFRLVGEMRGAVLILAIFASGSVLLTQSALDNFLPLRARSIRVRSSAEGVSMPLSAAIRFSISR
jgi:hypothetical protein